MVVLANGVELPLSEVFDDMTPVLHIGKRSSKFIWAQEPEKVIAFCKENKDKIIIYNEYHEYFTGSQFLNIIKDLNFNCDLIGREFC